MHDDHQLIEGRVKRALSHRIRPAVHAQRVPLQLQVWHVPGEPVPVEEALAASYDDFPVGAAWGAPWSTSWIRARGTVPAEWAGRRVEARFDLGFVGDWPGNQAEALVHTADGVPIKGVAPDNQVVPLLRVAEGGESVDLLLEAAANPDILADDFRPTQLGDVLTADPAPLYTMKAAELVVLDEDVWQLAIDLEVLDELMLQLPESQPRRWQIARAIDAALDALDPRDVPGTAAAAREQLVPVLTAPAVPSAHRVSAVGHAHIDSAWLWPLRETRRKTARTFSSVTALAKEYPEFVFACSSAQQYAWVEEHHPHVFARIREAIDAGQWAPVGGMWVEADGNLPGGEAMARQLVVGQEYFMSRFGEPCHGVWLPDSFGYTGAYPQLARLAGMEWFLTQKISWNQTNPFPHHTFWWEGIDGTRIFTHFPPVDTYNAIFSGEEMAHAVANFRDKGRANSSLAPFGHGDGGGGPTREMLERARRLRDLEGSAQVVIEHPDAFFAHARSEYEDAPVWRGELYLELHRGTYTSQARTKSGNRRSEHLLREAELWATTAAVRAGAPYPAQELDELWKTVLLHQFHDILPGSSIAWVHREAEATYGDVAARLGALTERAVAALADTTAHREQDRPEARWVANTAPVAVTAAVDVDDAPVLVHLPASGLADLASATVEPTTPVTASTTDAGTVLDNGLLRVVVDADGLLTSVLDLAAGRELLAPGERANLLQLHDDFPNYWDAWDVDQHYRHRVLDLVDAESVELVESGPVRATVRVARAVRGSRFVQTYRLTADSARLDLRTDVDWHETETMLKVAFPLDVHAEHAQSEIQFGHVQRPTHVNTSWDSARFETAAHRWVRVAEPGYGVAVANDATYGHDTLRHTRPEGGTTTTVRLSLLRSPRVPDPGADQGAHSLGYALLPAVDVADAVAAGYALNLPVRVGRGTVPATPALVEVTGDGAVLETVKAAQDGSGDVVVRLYESAGGRARAVVVPGFDVERAWTTDLLERPLEHAGFETGDDGSVHLPLRPFQVATVRLSRR